MTISVNAKATSYSQLYNNKHTVVEKEDNQNWFSDWLDDKDKVCTDSKDDGSISIGEAAKSFGKGLIGIVKGIINNPVSSAIGIAAGLGITFLTGGAAAPALIALGVFSGVGMLGYGTYKAVTAETDAEAKEAWETMGNGTFALGTSFFGSKAALKAAGKAGVKSALGSNGMSYTEATIQCIKSSPESLKVSGSNIVQNTKVLLGLAKPKVLSADEIFEMEKRSIENKYYREMKQASKGMKGLNNRYPDLAYQKRAMELINKDNIELAKQLYGLEVSGKNSAYLVEREQFCKYYNETIPKILKNNNPELNQLALDILADQDIHCKSELLHLLNPRNIDTVREAMFVGMKKPSDYNSLISMESIRPKTMFSEPSGIFFGTDKNGSTSYLIRNAYGEPCLTMETNDFCDTYKVSRMQSVLDAKIQSENAKVASLLAQAKETASNSTEINALLQQRAQQVEQINSLRLKYKYNDFRLLQQSTHQQVSQEIEAVNSQKISAESLLSAYEKTAEQINQLILRIKDNSIW